MNRKGFAPILVIVVVVVILIAGGIWYWKIYQASTVQNMILNSNPLVGTTTSVPSTTSPITLETNASTTNATSNSEMDNWKTYTDQQYGFEFKYPPEWNVSIIPNRLALESLSVDQPTDDEGDNGITVNVSTSTLPAMIKYLQSAVTIIDNHQEEINGSSWTVLTYQMNEMSINSTSYLLQGGGLLFQIAGFASNQNQALMPLITKSLFFYFD